MEYPAWKNGSRPNKKMNWEAIFWYLVLADSVAANFVAWFSRIGTRRTCEPTKHFRHQGWCLVYLFLMLWLGWALLRQEILPGKTRPHQLLRNRFSQCFSKLDLDSANERIFPKEQPQPTSWKHRVKPITRLNHNPPEFPDDKLRVLRAGEIFDACLR